MEWCLDVLRKCCTAAIIILLLNNNPVPLNASIIGVLHSNWSSKLLLHWLVLAIYFFSWLSVNVFCQCLYNTIQLRFDIALLTGSSEVHLHALAEQMQ